MAITSQTHTSTGGTTYAITFPYLSTSDIRVTLDGVATTAFSVNNSNQVVLNPAPSNGVVINIFRETDDSESKLVFSTGSSIKAADLNNAFKQSLYLNQEFAQLADDESPELGGDLDLNGKFVRGILKVQANSSSQGQIRLYCQHNDSLHYAAIKAPPADDFTGDLTFRIPSSYGTNGQVLASDGSGGTSWVSVPSYISVDPNSSAGLTYNNSNGVFTYTAPDLSNYLTDYTVTAADLNSISIDALSDVTSTGASTGDVLKWNGSQWTAQADNVGSGGGGGLTRAQATAISLIFS